MVLGLPEGVGAAGWRRTKGGNWDNCNSIINKTYFKKCKATDAQYTVTKQEFLENFH